MRFIIVRHGEAEYHNEDDTRKLTPRGRKEAESTGRFLNYLNVKPRYIIHSIKERSHATALIISEILNATNGLHFEKNAGPDGDLHHIMDIVMNVEDPVILVSHIPLVNKISNYLLSGDHTRTILRFDTGTVLILDRNNNFKSGHISNQWRIYSFLKPLDCGY